MSDVVNLEANEAHPTPISITVCSQIEAFITSTGALYWFIPISIDVSVYVVRLFVPNDALTACFNCTIIQVDALRLRLEEKESFLNKKTKQLQDLTEEKGTLAGEIRDMKDMLEVKERKINVLQKKVRKTRRNLS